MKRKMLQIGSGCGAGFFTGLYQSYFYFEKGNNFSGWVFVFLSVCCGIIYAVTYAVVRDGERK